MKLSPAQKRVLQKAQALNRTGYAIDSLKYHGVREVTLKSLASLGLLKKSESYRNYHLTPAGKAWLAESGETV